MLLRHGQPDVSIIDGTEQLLALSASGRYHLNLARDGKGLDVRVFGGKYLDNSTNHPRYNWRMDGTSGYYDYTYDELYFGRVQGDGLWRQQVVLNQGGFKVPTAVGQSNDWIAALNLELQFPIDFPLALFADIGTSSTLQQGEDNLIFSGGVMLPLASSVMEVYIPLVYSAAIRRSLEANDTRFVETIRFRFNIAALDPKRNLNSFFE